jgi:hypothetical protein
MHEEGKWTRLGVCVCVCVCVCVGTRGRQQTLDQKQLRDTGCAVAEQASKRTRAKSVTSRHYVIWCSGGMAPRIFNVHTSWR